MVNDMANKVAVNTAITPKAWDILKERSAMAGVSQAKLLRDIIHAGLGMPEERHPLEAIIRRIVHEELSTRNPESA
ncbi:hypothetical protein [Fimbriiglobus ruber]|uniref:hypothetical protein n=1 Tax=Fimbriiglobus ruber TaxID=1908690 RepID=UPI00117A8008|nr:hypothetical protein [Fimbriiglobus ruber]